MSAAAEKLGLKGTANWLFIQAQEEMSHGTHIYQYIIDRSAEPSFAAIQEPPVVFSNINEIFKKVLAHEIEVTRRINDIASLAMQENDHACYQFIMWFVNEQVEEEANATDILGKLQIIDADKGSLLLLDNELATRVFVNPFNTAA